jgi:1-acyl-sn-glycerol-3-phosphate acyltransferase
MPALGLAAEAFLLGMTRLLTGAVVKTRGFKFEPAAQRIYYANHTSHLDTLLILASIPRPHRKAVRPVAAREYWWKSPWRRWFAEEVFHAVPLPREPSFADPHPLRALEEALAKGDSLIFFPEGTRGDGAKVQPFKSGLYHLAAAHSDTTLVPVYIGNLNRVLPKGEAIPVPILCTVTFGEAFTFEAGEAKAEFLAYAQSRLEALATE